jgi:hypothetical protein
MENAKALQHALDQAGTIVVGGPGNGSIEVESDLSGLGCTANRSIMHMRPGSAIMLSYESA